MIERRWRSQNEPKRWLAAFWDAGATFRFFPRFMAAKRCLASLATALESDAGR
jgi:hypothetical protein